MIRRRYWDNITPEATSLAQLFNLADSEPWRRDALCLETDPETFFPDKGGSSAAAKRVCATCPALEACREWAIEHPEQQGVAGGLSERERILIRRARRAAALEEAS